MPLNPLFPLFSQEAYRCSEIIRAHIADGKTDGWVAVRLSDGGTDGIVYDTRRNAIRFQLHETQCAYVQVPWDNFPVHHAERFLAIHRDLYKAGFRMTDPDDDRRIFLQRGIGH